MSKRFKSFLAMLCVVVILASMMSGFVLAEEADEESGEPLVIEYNEIPLYIDGEFIGTGFKLGSVTYVPMLAFCEAMLMTDFEAEWDQELGSVHLSAEDIDISLTLSDNYIVANGRYLYLADGAYNINGTIMAPIRELAKIFNLEIHWDYDDWSIDIDTSDLVIFESGDEFYDELSVYWLSRVISSEAGAEPMEGRIGVGNVVINRAEDDSGIWADTIKKVIFQPGQFSVVEAGGIYLEPNEESVIAAKMCLEGYNTVGDSKFFFNPETSSSSWFEERGIYVTSISHHDFYDYNFNY